jgi:diguanylate cyclase (GGDEF)-like protein
MIRDLPGCAELPLVAICGHDDAVFKALAEGCTDAARKPVNWQLVGRRLELLVRMSSAVEELGRTRRRLREAELSAGEAERRLRLQNSVDHLTDLPNRSRFEDLVDRALTTAASDASLAVLYLDIARFKAINEIVGRVEGDQILRQVAARLRGCLQGKALVSHRRPGVGTAAVARMSGDEFTLLLTHVAGRRAVLQAAQVVLGVMAEPFAVTGRKIYLSVTLGVTVSAAEARSGELLLQQAELAMCEAKRQGGGMVRFYEESMENLSQRKVDLHRMLHAALEQGELSLHYQPLVDAASGRVVAAEALMRWQNAELGSVGPADFLPAAEGTDLMLTLGEWVLRTACRQLKEWADAGLPRIRMAVNIASCQLRRSDLAKVVRDVLNETGIDPRLLELELSEQGVFRHDVEILAQLEEIKRLGVRLSVDDFGTGQSAIGYLKRFPLDVLKIDRSYVAGLMNSESDAGIASAMVAMAHSLDLAVVAEGVEEESQLDLLREWGCDELQGFLFSPAVREEEFRQLLENGFAAAAEPANAVGSECVEER